MKLSKIFLSLFASVALLSCSDDDAVQAQSFNYEQYGQPFANMPLPQDAVIYQVNVRSFSPEGTLNAVRQRLSYIKELGANVVYLMPIYPIGQVNMAGAAGSPYSVQNYTAISAQMGTLEDLRALVNEAHSLDMAVMLDWVANHTSYDNAWITQHPDWYQQDEEGNIISPPGTNWADVAQLNFESTEMRKAMIDAMAYWVYNANIDGFRCDAADYVPQNFWAEANTALRGIKKNQKLLMLAEGSRFNHFTAGFDYTFGFGFFAALDEVYHDNKPATHLQDVNASEYANNYNYDWRIIRYSTNHDVNLSHGSAMELFNGARGSMAAFVVASYMKSVPMVYNAQEIGYVPRIDFLNDAPIDWSTPDNDMLEEYKKIIAFRKSSNAVKRGAYTGYSSNAVSAFTMEKDGEKVLILANLTNANANYILPAQLAAETWTDGLTGTAANLPANVNLAAYEYRILKN
ncbi:alpha-amylase [Flavobacterium akiainvivens]|uniref:Alpha-amylase n=1 Tax=Flavobacterium akiainvivens TaxID=1202724 RepID=A0A0M8M8B3_9FLAO|nr:alpha-amylase family glycosyl hydrolase [Flavobacterium akiainvivens]KOS05603.1 alpha-amylase [Flavobacterium akiainvivens]SFQ35186.1 Glycosidase [Flavobacterium akiainvivens]